MRTLWAKLVSMVLANAASLQVGAEGPMIHIGAVVGNGVSQAQSKVSNFIIMGSAKCPSFRNSVSSFRS